MQKLFSQLSESLNGVSTTLAGLVEAARSQQQALRLARVENIQSATETQGMLLQELQSHENQVMSLSIKISHELKLPAGISLSGLILHMPQDLLPHFNKMLGTIERDWEKLKMLNQSNMQLTQNAMTINGRLISVFKAHLKPLYGDSGGYETVNRENSSLNKKV